MSLKRHCETCDATGPVVPFDGWLTVQITEHLPFRTMAGSALAPACGDFCSARCLVAKLLTIPGQCVTIEQTVREHMEAGHDT